MRIRLGTIIAERELSTPDGLRVIARLGKPRQFPSSEDFYCPYQILGVGSQSVRRAGGVDAMQALQLALKMIGADLYTSDEYATKRISWNDSRDLGFPVPDSIQDILPAQSRK
ncbi:MAG TPA: hypothetical protein VGB91_05770 [Rhizomicrobium sp.]